MRAVFLITLVAFGSFAQGRFDRTNQRTDQGRSKRGFLPQSGAFFEFAPPSGAGMGTACACAAITGAKGEALTFTRAGDATCSRQGLATTGIANGDLVVCTANQPRVESSGGVLGLRVEAARTNETLRSQQIENAAWTGSAVGVAAPIITANAAIAPDDTLTAERVQVPLTTGGQYSYMLQVGGIGATWSSSVYVRGNGTSGTMHLWSGTTPNACVLCSYVSGSWSRCSVTTPPGVAGALGFGNDSTNALCVTAGAVASALDVFVWQAQNEQGAYATSPIPTVAAAVTRNLEDATVPSVSIAGFASTGCARAYVARPAGATNGTAVSFSNSNGRPLYFTAGNQTVFDGTNNPSLATTFNGSSKWYITRWTGGSLTLHNQDTAAATTAFDGTMGVAGPLQLGNSVTNLQADGLISHIQLDPSPTRCTP